VDSIEFVSGALDGGRADTADSRLVSVLHCNLCIRADAQHIWRAWIAACKLDWNSRATTFIANGGLCIKNAGIGGPDSHGFRVNVGACVVQLAPSTPVGSQPDVDGTLHQEWQHACCALLILCDNDVGSMLDDLRHL